MGKSLQTAATLACQKSLMMIFNFIFWMTGIVILGIGVWMQVELHKYMEINTDFSENIPYVLIGTGSFIIIIGSLACCCTIKGQTVLMIIYGLFLVMIFFLEVGIGISIYEERGNLKEGFNKGLTYAMTNYRNESPNQAIDFDLMQETLHCCGNHQSSDWGNLNPPQPVPPSCCIKKDCDPADDKQIYTQGCFDKVIQFFDSNIKIVAGAAIGIAFFPMIGVILTLCLVKTLFKAKYEQMA